jgi:hypothetical protein
MALTAFAGPRRLSLSTTLEKENEDRTGLVFIFDSISMSSAGSGRALGVDRL